MHAIAKQYADVPLGHLCLRHALYKRLHGQNVHTIGDLFSLPEDVLAPDLAYLLERISRFRQGHVPQGR